MARREKTQVELALLQCSVARLRVGQGRWCVRVLLTWRGTCWLDAGGSAGLCVLLWPR